MVKLNQAIIFLGVLLFLAGCDTWMGQGDKSLLPGKRLSVLVFDDELTADSKATPAIDLSPAWVNKEWPLVGGSESHSMGVVAFSEQPVRQWRAHVGKGAKRDSGPLPQPIIAQGKVFVMDAGGEVQAYELGSGRCLWKSKIKSASSSPGCLGGGLAAAPQGSDGGRLYVTMGYKEVYCLDISTGAVKWTYTAANPVRIAPTVANGRVFVLTISNELKALNGSDGQLLWSHAGIEEQACILGGSPPTIDKDVVFVSYSSGEIFALKVENGFVLWEDSLAGFTRRDTIASLSHIKALTRSHAGEFYALSHSGQLVAIALHSGQRQWDRVIPLAKEFTVEGPYLFIVTSDEQLLAFSRAKGKVKWIKSLRNLDDEKASAKGRIGWTSPIFAGSSLIVAGSNGHLVFLSPHEGSVQKVIQLPGAVSVSPIIADQTLVILTDDGTLEAYR